MPHWGAVPRPFPGRLPVVKRRTAGATWRRADRTQQTSPYRTSPVEGRRSASSAHRFGIPTHHSGIVTPKVFCIDQHRAVRIADIHDAIIAGCWSRNAFLRIYNGCGVRTSRVLRRQIQTFPSGQARQHRRVPAAHAWQGFRMAPRSTNSRAEKSDVAARRCAWAINSALPYS